MRPFAVIGLGRFGRAVAQTLTSKGAEVLAVDRDIEIVEEMRDQVTQAVCMDATDENAIRASGLEEVEAAVVAIGEGLEESILATTILKRVGVPRIIARAVSELHGTILESVGATRIIRIEELEGSRLARSLLATDIREAIPLASGHSLAEVYPRPEFLGRSLQEMDLRNRYGVNVVAIMRRVAKLNKEGKETYELEVNDLPRPDDTIQDSDLLVVVGSDENIQKLARE